SEEGTQFAIERNLAELGNVLVGFFGADRVDEAASRGGAVHHAFDDRMDLLPGLPQDLFGTGILDDVAAAEPREAVDQHDLPVGSGGVRQQLEPLGPRGGFAASEAL